MTPTFPTDFNNYRIAFAREIQLITGLTALYEEPETQGVDRPAKPYMSFKFTTPAAKNGDDTKSSVLDDEGNPTTFVNSGGVRKMTVSFNVYGNTHEESYNFMGLWQTRLDMDDVQEHLRAAGIAVGIIGNVADLSQLLNTGFEGRSHMECTFNIAMNYASDLGEMAIVPVNGDIDLGNSTDEISLTVQLP